VNKIYSVIFLSAFSWSVFAQEESFSSETAHCEYLPQGLLQSWSEDRNLWAGDISYIPVVEGEYPEQRLTGMEINRLAPSNFLFEVGLREGDVLSRLNGVAFGDVESFTRVIKGVSLENELILEFENRPALRLINTDQFSGLTCNS